MELGSSRNREAAEHTGSHFVSFFTDGSERQLVDLKKKNETSLFYYLYTKKTMDRFAGAVLLSLQPVEKKGDLFS